MKALKEDLEQAHKDLHEKETIIKKFEMRATSLSTDQEKHLEKARKLEAKVEQLKAANMDLRKQIADTDKANQGKF